MDLPNCTERYHRFISKTTRDSRTTGGSDFARSIGNPRSNRNTGSACSSGKSATVACCLLRNGFLVLGHVIDSKCFLNSNSYISKTASALRVCILAVTEAGLDFIGYIFLNIACACFEDIEMNVLYRVAKAIAQRPGSVLLFQANTNFYLVFSKNGILRGGEIDTVAIGVYTEKIFIVLNKRQRLLLKERTQSERLNTPSFLPTKWTYGFVIFEAHFLFTTIVFNLDSNSF